MRLRFFGPMRELSHEMAARLTQIDYDREMAFLLLDGRGAAGRRPARRRSRASSRPSSRWSSPRIASGRGYGDAAAATTCCDYAKARGVKRVIGHVLRENHRMLELSKRLGFAREGGRSGEPTSRGEADGGTCN